MNPPILALKQIRKHFIDNNLSLSVAESCTGGLISFWLSHLAKASQYFKGALISYQTEVKIQHLGLSLKLIEKQGLASTQVAEQMAQGVKKLLKSDWALSVTGIAGPAKGEKGENIGTVAFSLCFNSQQKSSLQHFKSKNRDDIRRQSALFALDFLISEF